MNQRPAIGTRISMPKRPKGYLSDKHPKGGRQGTVTAHYDIYADCVDVSWDGIDDETTMELWKWFD